MWAGVLALVFGAALALVVSFPSPAPEGDSRENVRAWLPPDEEQQVQPTAVRLAEPLAVASRFIRTAVARKRVGESWDLVAPSLRQGFTRAQWAKGDIPIVPYPVDSAKWQLDYSFRDAVSFKVALFPPPGRKVRAIVFNLDLRKFDRGDRGVWLVEGFTPGVVRSVPASSPRTSVTGFPDLGSRIAAREGESRLTAAWLAVPFGILGLALLIPVAFGVSSWYRVRRAERDYRRDSARML